MEGFSLYMISRDVSLVITAVVGFFLGFCDAVFRFSGLVVMGFVSFSYRGGFFDGIFPVVSISRGIDIRANLCSKGRSFCRFVVPSSEGALVFIVRVVVVGGWPSEWSFGSGYQRFATLTPPLFFDVAFGRFFVCVFSGRTSNLFFRIAEFYSSYLVRFYCNLFPLFFCLDGYFYE